MSRWAGFRKKIRHPEDDLQEAVIQWFRLRYPNRLMFHVPNGRGRFNIRQAVRLKKQGVLPGVADLFVAEPSVKGWHGLFIELKAGKNSQTREQKLFETAVKERGYAYQVARTIDEFMMIIKWYLGETK